MTNLYVDTEELADDLLDFIDTLEIVDRRLQAFDSFTPDYKSGQRARHASDKVSDLIVALNKVLARYDELNERDG